MSARAEPLPSTDARSTPAVSARVYSSFRCSTAGRTALGGAPRAVILPGTEARSLSARDGRRGSSVAMRPLSAPLIESGIYVRAGRASDSFMLPSPRRCLIGCHL